MPVGLRRIFSSGVFAAIMGIAVLQSAVRADVVIFKNGDKITGTIETADGGKLVITTVVGGKITVDMKDVKTFSTDAPIKLEMNDGTVLNQKIDAGSDGNFKTTAGAAIAPQEISIDRIAKINPPPVVWTGSIVINGTYTEGNTNTEGLGASFDASRRSDNDRITLAGQYLFAKQKVNGVTTTSEDNWFLSGGYDYFFTKRFYGMVDGRVEKDRINFLDVRVTPAAGVGYQWIEQPDMHFSTEAGIAWVYEKYTNSPTNDENVSVKLAYHADKSFDDNKYSVFSDTTFLPSVQNDVGKRFILLFDAGARVNLTKRMFSELKMEWTMDSNPAPGAHKSDFKYILGVGVTF